MIENSLWVEKYRPKTLSEYVGNSDLIRQVSTYIESGDVPHLLFYGDPGQGKTTLSKLIANSVDADTLYINASVENNIETVRTKIMSFASSASFRQWKIVILDEADYFSASGAAALRALMEEFSHTCRFILTCNYINKIIPALRSRALEIEIHAPSKADVARRVVYILESEGVLYTPDQLKKLILAGYPDIRTIIKIAQSSVVDGQLHLTEVDQVKSGYLTDILEVLKATPKTALSQIRKILADSKLRDFTGLYTFLYSHLSDFANGKEAEVIILIADYQYKDSLVVDKEINVAALLSSILKLTEDDLPF